MDILPKKSLGQHWLNDEKFLKAIADAADLSAKDTIVEIGPGHGTLTNHLTAVASKVIAIELDKILASNLKTKVNSQNLEVVNHDCLSYDYTALPKGYKVVANIPYYLTSKLLQVLSENPNPPATIVLLIQKEVAERVASNPGNMSILSVSVQLYYSTKLGIVVPAEYFTPPPKVDSQVIILNRYKTPLFNNLDNKQFFRAVKAGFSQKRKKLRSSLSGGLGISKDEATKIITQAGVNPDSRPQELSLEQWKNISDLT